VNILLRFLLRCVVGRNQLWARFVSGCNLGLLMRVKYGLLKPRRLSDAVDGALIWLWLAWRWLVEMVGCLNDRRRAMWARSDQINGSLGLQAA
jgi:hypothetical protein